MIVVRYVFQAKFGRGDEMVQAYKAASEQLSTQATAVRRARLLTDLTGPFFTVVNELEFDSLADWETYRGQIFSNPVFQQMMAQTGDPSIGPRRGLHPGSRIPGGGH